MEIEEIKICNYPNESKSTFSYVVALGEGYDFTTIVFNDLTEEERALATIIGEAQNSLIKLIKKRYENNNN